MKKAYNDRMYVINMIFIAIGIIFVLRLFFIQIVNKQYKLSADNNVFRYLTIYPTRGLIYDRNGKLLVYNEAVYDLMLIPKQLKIADTNSLCQILGISKEDFIAKVKKAKSYSLYRPSIFEKQLSKETYGYLQEKLFEYGGFFVQSRTLRKYPMSIAAHVLGYIGEINQTTIDKDPSYRAGDYVGISGIEKSYENELKGKKGIKIIVVDVHNIEKGSYMNGKYDSASVSGKDLYTTLDADLQQYGEFLMQNKRGSIVAIDPKTGEILALVSSPTYDPNLLIGRVRGQNYTKLLTDKLKPLFDRALMAQYPPGSTFKIVNALIGEQDGVLKENTTFSCEGGFSFGNLRVRCHRHSSPLDLVQSIQHSCNAYYCKSYLKIISNRKFRYTADAYNSWRNQVLSFGFGKKFYNDLPHELSGIIPSSKYYDKYHGKRRWNAYSIISLAIGQGEICVTPLQLANLSAIIANRGHYYIPHIVKYVHTKNNINTKYTNRINTSVDPKYFDPVIEGMYRVVQAGTASNIRVDTLAICGKTGTAQNPHGKNHSLFIAFAPKDNPKIAISVVVENSGYGNEWAAPIAGLMIEKYLYRIVKRLELEQKMIEGNLIQ